MSWQATAWAVKQTTGASGLKLLLLTLANYADANGHCWPAQQTLAEDTESSVDTVQRGLRKLVALGLITALQKPRRAGQWPQRAYQLAMSTGPQNAARQVLQNGENGGAQIGAHEDEPGRTTPAHRAAPRPLTGPHHARPPGRIAMRHEQSIEPSIEQTEEQPPPPQPAANDAAGARTGEKKREPTQAVQNRVVDQLGSGDVASGWLLYGALDGRERSYLEGLARMGPISHAELMVHRAAATERMALDRRAADDAQAVRSDIDRARASNVRGVA